MSIGTRSVTLAVPMLLPLLAAAGFAHPNPQPAPELPASLYRDRRERLMKEIGGCAAAIAAQGEPTGVVQEYRQDDDFFWLTGINEPGAWLILMPKAKYCQMANRLVHNASRFVPT